MEGLEDTSNSAFSRHPSYHQIATFFLGFVFVSCLHYTFHVPLAAARRIRSYVLNCRAPHGGVGLEANRLPGGEKVQRWLGSNRSTHATMSSVPSHLQASNLVLSLTVCLAMASVADFGSLLVFDRTSGLPACAFLVAWGGISAQSARLLGLLKLSIDLKRLGVARWETVLFWGWLVMALVVMFATNAISIGKLSALGLGDHALCYRTHDLVTAVVTTGVDLVPEVYALFRIYCLIVPAFLSPRHKFDALWDVRVLCAISLLISDLATAVPAAHFFSILADFIPSSLAALIVLAAFNQRSPDMTLASTASIPGTRPDSFHSMSTIEIKKMPSSRSLAEHRQRISHPFAASALLDPSPETEDWPESASPHEVEKPYLALPETAAAAAAPRGRRQTWRSSSQSGVSESDSEIARSVKGAVVGFAFKDVIGPSRKHRDRSFLPAMPPMAEVPTSARAEVLPRGTPLRVPRPVVPPQPQRVDALEQASREQASRELISSTPAAAAAAADAPPPPPSPPSPPYIAITSASPLPSAGTSHRPSISISVPSSTATTATHGSSDNSTKSSLHLTPSTPAHSQQPSRRASASSDSDWRYDTRHDSFGSHRSSDEAVSPTQGGQAQRHSGASSRLPPADDDLSIVYEASHEDSDSVPPSRAYRPTFGEHMFVEGGIGRPISTPVGGVPEDVQEGGQSHGTPSSNSSKP